MCRLVAYKGASILLEDVLVKPINSIIMQSIHARESTIPTNGDGFGLGWYAPEISDTPALFTSTSPAWNDQNLLHLTSKIKSPLFFSHVRAASTGGVTPYNCHPFIYKQWMFMHNGEIYNFLKIKRHLRRLLDDEFYEWIKGDTDSEHFFALFLQFAKGKKLNKITQIGDILRKTFVQIELLLHEHSNLGPCFYNLCLTDGQRILATRYCTDYNVNPESMHYSLGAEFSRQKDNFYHMIKEKGNNHTLLISSEKLNNFDVDWQDVPVNHMILVDSDMKIHLQSI